MKKCKICKHSLKKAKKASKKAHRGHKKIRYCSTMCFQMYLDSYKFEKELCESLGIKPDSFDKFNAQRFKSALDVNVEAKRLFNSKDDEEGDNI